VARYDYLIVGGGMTADAAAHGIRREDTRGSIAMVGAESHAPYNRPPLTKGLWKGDPEDSIWRKTGETGAELVRGRRLKERYALLWLATGAVLLVLSVWREGLNTMAGWLGVSTYPPAVLFAVATLFILLVLLHYSTVISRLTDENVDLAQRIALLEERLSRGSPPDG